MNCVVYMDLRPFECAQILGGLKLSKLGNFLLKIIAYKGCNSGVIFNLLTGYETWVHIFEPQRRADNKQWKQKKKKKKKKKKNAHVLPREP